MSAEILREAAALMRERAEAATPGPWVAHHRGGGLDWLSNSPHTDSTDHEPGSTIGQQWGSLWPNCNAAADAEHIAAADPPFVLAVADLLDAAHASFSEASAILGHPWHDESCECLSHKEYRAHLALARAYIGDPR